MVCGSEESSDLLTPSLGFCSSLFSITYNCLLWHKSLTSTGSRRCHSSQYSPCLPSVEPKVHLYNHSAYDLIRHQSTESGSLASLALPSALTLLSFKAPVFSPPLKGTFSLLFSLNKEQSNCPTWILTYTFRSPFLSQSHFTFFQCLTFLQLFTGC